MGLIVVHRGDGHVPYVASRRHLDSRPSRERAAAARAPDGDRPAAGDDGPALAARLPILRPAVARRLIATTALANAAIGGVVEDAEGADAGAHASRRAAWCSCSALSRGDVLPHDPQQLALAAGPAVAGCIGMGFGARRSCAACPSAGPPRPAGVAYAGTRVLGAARLRL